MTASFTPRPIYRVKPYGYLAEAGDTAEGITRKFGLPASRYAELVASNLQGRRLMPQPLGSPFGARTFAAIREGEMLKIPAHWPDVASALGDASGAGGSVQAPDAIVQGISALLASANAASGSGAIPPQYLPAVVNAATQWWMNTQGTTPGATPADYAPYVTQAVGWWNTYGAKLAESTGPAPVAAFPWGPLLAMLPTQTTIAELDWNGTIPGANGATWANLPWAYLAQVGPDLEKIKPAPVNWSDTSVAGLLKAFQDVIAPALANINVQVTITSCGKNAAQDPKDGQCNCLPGYTWATATYDPNNPASWDCVPIPAGTQPTGGTTQPTGGTTPAGTQPTGGTTQPARPSTASTTTTALAQPPSDDSTTKWLIAAGIIGATAIIAGGIALGALHAKNGTPVPTPKRAPNPLYIVYVDGEERGMIKAKNHNDAEKKAQKLHPGRQVMVEYTEV